jgi:hypothetical protein
MAFDLGAAKTLRVDDIPGADPAVPDYWYETSQGNDLNDAGAPTGTVRFSG